MFNKIYIIVFRHSLVKGQSFENKYPLLKIFANSYFFSVYKNIEIICIIEKE